MSQILMADLIPEDLQPPMALDVFIERMGITRNTAYVWRKQGILTTVNICGRQYVPAREIVKFNRRCESGEFAKTHKTPTSAARAITPAPSRNRRAK